MRSLLECFDQIYIISLADRQDRRIECIREFAAVGVCVPSSRIKFFLAEKPKEIGNFPSVGSRGSFTSHLAVLKIALEMKVQRVLIVEDDVFLGRPSIAHVNGLITFMNTAKWDVLYFGYLSPKVILSDKPIVPWSEPTIGGHFYAVNASFIPRMIEYMTVCQTRPRDHPLGGPTFRDGAFNNVKMLYPELEFYLSNPSIAGQRSSRTDLHHLGIYDRVRLLRPVLAGYRKLKNAIRRFRASGASDY